MLCDPWFWLLGIPAVVLIGLGKGGFVGVGTLALPLMAQALPPVQAAAVLLPLLIAQDAVGVWTFRTRWDRRIMRVMLPGAIVGIGIGYWFAASLPEAWILLAVGFISFLFGLQRLWVERGGRAAPSHRLPDWTGTLCGSIAGLCSQIAHAGAPPYQLWVIPQRLERDTFVGTTMIFFAAMNWIKVPAYAALGQFSAANLLASAALLPIATVSTLAGIWLVRRIDAERFYTLIYWMMVLLGVKLLWDGAAQLAA